MAEFESGWPGWQFKTGPEQVHERFFDPDQGVALVETGVDVHGFLNYVDRNVDNWFDPSPSEASYYWGRRNFHSRHRPTLKSAALAIKEVMGPLEEAVTAEGTNFHDRFWPLVIIQRRTKIGPTHSDIGISTAWLGATKPALRIYAGNEWIPIDDVPSGHAFIWRGELVKHGGQLLPPTLHQAAYRSVARRIVMIV